jgi:hypothetical protein
MHPQLCLRNVFRFRWTLGQKRQKSPGKTTSRHVRCYLNVFGRVADEYVIFCSASVCHREDSKTLAVRVSAISFTLASMPMSIEHLLLAFGPTKHHVIELELEAIS